MPVNGGVPKKMSERHRLVALLTAAGLKNKAIGKQLGFTQGRLSIIKKSPLFQAIVEQHRAKIADLGLRDAVAKIVGDAPANIDFIRKVRDGYFEGDDAEHLRIRMGAAGVLLDRQVSKKVESTSTVNNTHRFLVEDRRRREIEADCEDIGEPIDADFKRVEPKRIEHAIADAEELEE